MSTKLNIFYGNLVALNIYLNPRKLLGSWWSSEWTCTLDMNTAMSRIQMSPTFPRSGSEESHSLALVWVWMSRDGSPLAKTCVCRNYRLQLDPLPRDFRLKYLPYRDPLRDYLGCAPCHLHLCANINSIMFLGGCPCIPINAHYSFNPRFSVHVSVISSFTMVSVRSTPKLYRSWTHTHTQTYKFKNMASLKQYGF